MQPFYSLEHLTVISGDTLTLTIILEAAGVSAAVSFVVSYLTVKFVPSGSIRRPGVQEIRSRPHNQPPPRKELSPRKREKSRARSLEIQTSPEHSAVLRKIASDMKSQLKGYTDSTSRVPVPVIVPEISNMALWSDLIRSHYIDEEFDFETKWLRYIELQREHSRLESNMYVDIGAQIKSMIVGYSAVNYDNVNTPPPENTVYYSSELTSSIMSNWLDAIRGLNPHFPLENPTDLGIEDAKKFLKSPDGRFLTMYNKKIASGAEIIIEQLEEAARNLLVNFHEDTVYRKYQSSLSGNETELTALEGKLREILSELESKPVFNGTCQYSR